MSDFWKGKNVLVAGGSGFIGSHLAKTLVAKGARVTATIRSSEGIQPLVDLKGTLTNIEVATADLTTVKDCVGVCKNQDVVVSAAHIDGSTSYKSSHPAFIFRQNLLMTLNLLEASRITDVGRLLVISSAEVYSPGTGSPIQEANGLGGEPDPQTRGYAWSKRMTELAAQLYGSEYSLNVAIARPNNVYGPNDHFDSKRGRIIPILIKRAVEASEPITIWGSGSQVRSFLYVKDLVHGLLLLLEKIPITDPINFSGLETITIRQLAQMIVHLVGTDVRIVTEPSKPAGPQSRILSIEKAREILGWHPETALEDGLKETIGFYRELQKFQASIKPEVASMMQ